MPVRVAAETEEVADAKTAKHDSYIVYKNIPGDGDMSATDILAVKSVFARQKYRREVGKEDVDGDSTDDWEVVSLGRLQQLCSLVFRWPQ